MNLTSEEGLARSSPQAAQPAGAHHVMFGPHQISGFWALSIDSRMIPKADLLPSVTEAEIKKHEEDDRKAIRYCDLLGLQYLMDPGRPIDIVQGQREIIIFAAVTASARHIYLSRTTHINPEIFDPTTNGDEIGHWEGNTLVVDTIGFSPTRGITMIPGGGFKTAKTHLVEHIQLLENGTILSDEFTWTDPTVYAKPHSYTFHYYRIMVHHYEPLPPLPCNPYDNLRTVFLGFPPTLPVKLSNVPGARK